LLSADCPFICVDLRRRRFEQFANAGSFDSPAAADSLRISAADSRCAHARWAPQANR